MMRGPHFLRFYHLGIIQYMLEQSKPPSTVVKTVKAMRNLLHHASDVTIIGCFTGEEDTTLETFQVAGNNAWSCKLCKFT